MKRPITRLGQNGGAELVIGRSITFVILFLLSQVANFHEVKFINCTALNRPSPVTTLPQH